MATLKELAEYTGFSIATISRVLNNDPTMSASEETRAAILDAAGKLQYHTAERSRRVRAPKRMELRVAIAEMLTPAQQLADPYYLYLKNFAEQRCFERKMEIIPLREQAGTYSLLTPTELDGILAIGIFSDAQVEQLTAFSENIVFLDSSPDELRFDSVVLNFRIGVEQALRYLREQGHREIGFIGPDRKLDQKKRPAPEVRRQYFLQYMEQNGLLNTAHIIETPMEAKSAHDAMAARIADGNALPTALLAANEETAIGAIGAMWEAGLRVPQDLSVISFNDTVISTLTNPPLTSISTHVADMSATAVDLLYARAAKKPAQEKIPHKIVIPPTLITRESVAAPKR